MNRNLPNLFIAGAAKSGTSSLHEYLGYHPDICMSEVKEPHYFSHPERFIKKEWYYSLFDGCEKARYRGESSTGYMVFPGVIERMLEELNREELKFIFILRNPIDRIYSHYWWLKGQGYETRPFREAVMADMKDEPLPEKVVIDYYKFYFQYSLYGKWLKKYFEIFGRDQIYIVTTESFRTDPLKELNAIFKWLGVEPLETVPEIESNKTKLLKYPRIYFLLKFTVATSNPLRNIVARVLPASFKGLILKGINYLIGVLSSKVISYSYPPLDPDTRVWLKGLLEDDVNLLKKITGKDFSEWNDFNN